MDLNLEDGHTSSSLSSSFSPSSVPGEQDVVVLRRCALRLRSASVVCVFKALKVCVLCDNFITDIEPLRQCVNLLKLDLKGNQITQLPEASFWKNLKALQLLFLHDNDISVMSEIAGLSVSPSLNALTLYETPLSRRRNYRHWVINSIFSLKALDHHIISDEEIIENWKLPLRFRAMTPNLSVRLYLPADMEADEVKTLRAIISEINRIQAAFSPTLIIQKWTRGYLTRRHLGFCRAPAPLKTLRRDLTPVGSVCEISRRSWIMNDHRVPLQQDMMSFRSFHSRTLTELNPPCNTPQPSYHGDVLNISFMDQRNDIMNLETFCLCGYNAITYLSKTFEDVLRSQKIDAQDIRNGISHFHTKKSNLLNAPWPRPPNIIPKKSFIGRHHDCLSLTTFRAMERTHVERNMEDGLRERAKRVMKAQNHREETRGHCKGFMEARRTEVLLRKGSEQGKLEEILKLQKNIQEQKVQLVHQKYLKFLMEKQRNMTEQETVKRFSRQHGALTKAFSKYYTEWRTRETLDERQRHIAISTLHTRSLKEQGHLGNRTQNKSTTSRVSINALPFREQHLSDREKSGEIQLFPGART
ncbi:uncharacterized protein lrriq3 isoform 1-T1 [Clarias gariepinus]